MYPVTERALIRRINRVLTKNNQALRKSRSNGELNNLGQFYVLDTYRNSPIDYPVDIMRLGRDLGVVGEAEATLVPS